MRILAVNPWQPPAPGRRQPHSPETSAACYTTFGTWERIMFECVHAVQAIPQHAGRIAPPSSREEPGTARVFVTVSWAGRGGMGCPFFVPKPDDFHPRAQVR